MPELPEVETIARSLRNPTGCAFSNMDTMQTRPGVIGRTILNCSVQWARTVAEPEVTVFQKKLIGQTILDVSRRGKFLVFKMTDGFMLMHLRMSGDVRVELNEPDTLQKHDRVIFSFVDGSRFVFNDPRKFGRIWLVNDLEYVLGNLGREPFDENLTPIAFSEMLKKRRRLIKTLLLDQTFLAGVGNIYSDEALYAAQIHPLQKSEKLSKEQAERLLDSIRLVLREGIQRNGASIDWVYRGGEFQNYFKVYQRTGKPCYRCGETIERIVLGQRSTHFCPNCQRIEE